jgi:hypothetical protein
MLQLEHGVPREHEQADHGLFLPGVRLRLREVSVPDPLSLIIIPLEFTSKIYLLQFYK